MIEGSGIRYNFGPTLKPMAYDHVAEFATHFLKAFLKCQMYLNDGLIMFQEAKLHQRRTVSMSAPQILVKPNTCDKCNRS